MDLSSRQRVPVMITVGVVIGCLLGLGWIKYVDLHFRAALGDEQTVYFVEAVQEASRSTNLAELSRYVAAITNYYPSGTKQRHGTHVDAMVERTRELAVRMLEERRTNALSLANTAK